MAKSRQRAEAVAEAEPTEPSTTEAEDNRTAATQLVEQVAEGMKMPPADAPPSIPQPSTDGEQTNGHAEEQATNGNGHAQAVGQRKPLPSKAGYWRDNEVGVRIEEDFKNHLTSMIFRDKAPAKAQELIQKSGFIKEDDYTFSKPVDHLRRREHREDVENLVLAVDNMLRKDKGLEPKQSFYISRA